MYFSSLLFLFVFLPIVLAVYYIVPRKFRNAFLLLANLIFYGWGEPVFILIMIVSVVSNYIFGLLIEKYRDNQKRKKTFLVLSLVISLGLLAVFKYTGFVTDILRAIPPFSFMPKINLPLPIGISFYTFQTLSYTIDVYRGDTKAQKSLVSFGTYVSFFPQLIAGPIVRYETIEKELQERTHSFEKIAYGIKRFTIGLAKKTIIANQLGALCTVCNAADEKTVVLYWISAISYMLQIYFDFSAYSDMAIGLGKIFGFSFLENFNYPYISKSITEFWRRWHISLGTWFKDYIYIPLGGSREGTKKLIRNILIVWTLTGIWHGANWNFIIWGLMFGIILIIEKLWSRKYLEKLPKIFRNIYVLFIVMISFIIFGADSLGQAFTNIQGLCGIHCDGIINQYTIYYLKSYLIILILAIIGATPLVTNIINKLKENAKINKIINIIEPIFIIVLLLIVTAYLVDSSYNPFLYFRF